MATRVSDRDTRGARYCHGRALTQLRLQRYGRHFANGSATSLMRLGAATNDSDMQADGLPCSP